MSKDATQLPPLPDLSIGAVEGYCGVTQGMVDHILQEMYQNRPDLFVRLMVEEKTVDDGTFQKATPISLADEVYGYIVREHKIQSTVQPSLIYFEARRRARLMAGLQY